KNQRYEIVKTWLSSFVITVVAVVAVTLFIPKSPEAQIIKYTTLLNEITYQVRITDEDHALMEDSLKVVLENQMEKYEISTSLGESSGMFKNLKENTEYRLSVYGNKGFGSERLDSVLLRTQSQVGGFILGYTKISDMMEPSYDVDILIHDPEGIYSNLLLYYGYTIDDQPFYQSISIIDTRQTVQLMHLFTQTHLYLEATTQDGVVILDEMWISPPFTLYSSIYVDYVDRFEIGYQLYLSSESDIDVTYTIELYQEDVKKKAITLYSKDLTEYEHLIVFDQLEELTTYKMIAKASYINPDTLQQETVLMGEEEVTTIGFYEITYEINRFVDEIEVIITVIDPSHYFQVPYYTLYDTSGEYPMWLADETFDFIPDVDSKSVQFTIIIPDVSDYKLLIAVRNENNYIIRHIVLDEIYHKE
ncbi:MAG: hypothetical protein RBR75_04185, partial [Acholeplasmataceae bacterium]|nr:hypothetical protein [Acholeplasmataceae bacterium]